MAVPGPDQSGAGQLCEFTAGGKAGEHKHDLVLNYRNCYDIKLDPPGNFHEVGPPAKGLQLRRLLR
jgi:hypothetical protein